MSVNLASSTHLGSEDACFTINGLDWSRYVAINEAFSETRGLRMLYLDGSLTLLSPSHVHETSDDFLDSIVKAIIVGCDVDIRPLSSTTLRNPKREAGLEGDRVYWLHENALSTAGLKEFDLAALPPPDLAIEGENSNKATDAVEIYARLKVPELWRHNVRKGTLTFWELGDDGT